MVTTSTLPSATVRISAVQEISNQPISRAHVTLESDTRSYDGYTDGGGLVRFSQVRAGEYHVTVENPDYRFKDRIIVIKGADASVRMIGIRSHLKAIASVQSRIAPTAKSPQRVSDDPQTLIAGSVGAALPSLSSLELSPDGSFLIHGHGASSTSVTLNGGALFPSGAATQLGLLGSDVFDSGQVNPGDTAGGPDGTLALHGFDPTIDWQGILQARAATFGSTASGFNLRGTSGRVGMALVHSNVNVADAFGGKYFADTSGLFYQHQTDANSRGDSATLRYGFDANHVMWLDFGQLSSARPLICRSFTGPLPCGYGPGNANSESLRYVQLRDQLTLDRLSVGLNIFRSQDRTNFNYSAERFFGQPIGFTSGTETARVGYSALIGFLVTPHRTISLSASGSNDRSASTGTYANAEYRYPPSTNVLDSVHLDIPVAETRKASLSTSVGSERSGSARSAYWGLKGAYRITSTNAVDFAVSSGRLGQPLYASGLSSPGNLLYDCAGNRALGFAPGDATKGGAKTEQYRLSFSHDGSRTSASAQIFHNVDNDAPVNAIVTATSLPGPFPSNYLALLNADENLSCGFPTNIPFSNVFYHVQGIADHTVTNGTDLSLTSKIGDKAEINLQYSLVYARPYGLSPILQHDPDVREGRLLPYVPAHRLDASLRYAANKFTTLLAAINFFGANNANQRTAYSSVSLGARLRTESGDFVAGIENLFDVGSGAYSRFAPFPYLSQPLGPRTFSFRYRIALGQQNLDKTQLLSAPFVPNANQIVFEANPFEKASPTALTAQTTSPFCGPEQLPQAKPILSAISLYRDYIENQIRAGSAAAIQPRAIGDLQLSYIPTMQYYTIRVALPHTVKGAGPFLRCASLHMGDYAAAQQMKIYIPGWRERYGNSIWVLYYAPQVGLYFPPNGIDETSSKTAKQMPFPDSRPLASIQIDPTSCPTTYRSAATEALSDLKKYIKAFYSGAHPGVPAGFRIASHRSKQGPWLEIRADDFGFNDALATCLDAPDATAKQLQAHGISGAIFPSLNYAPGVGFYKADNLRTGKL